jgi:hypothetical protein
MEKKIYLKPEAEVLDFMFESELLANTINFSGNEDEIELPTPTTPDPDKPIEL